MDEEPVEPRLHSVEIPNSTAEELFHRLSADWKMITNAAEARIKDATDLPPNTLAWEGEASHGR